MLALTLVAVLPSTTIASLIAIAAVLVLGLFSGFRVIRTRLPDAYIWGPYVSPLHYVFDGVSLNEFFGKAFHCTTSQLLPPTGAPITSAPYPAGFSGAQACPFTTGLQFLASQALSTHWWHRWGDLAALVGIWAILTVLCMLCFAYIRYTSEGGQPHGSTPRPVCDMEMPEPPSVVRADAASVAVLAWRNVSCYVDGKHRVLNSVSGYVLPGMFLAVMGESGP